MKNPKAHTIGWIGTGRMGFAMAKRLLQAGCAVSIYNRTRSKAEPLAEYGGKIVDTPRLDHFRVTTHGGRQHRHSSGGVRFATCTSFTLGCDRRLIDGVLGAQLPGAFRDWATRAA